jgi:hypothetical protein
MTNVKMSSFDRNVPRNLRLRRGQGAQYETKLPYWEAPAVASEFHFDIPLSFEF